MRLVKCDLCGEFDTEDRVSINRHGMNVCEGCADPTPWEESEPEDDGQPTYEDEMRDLERMYHSPEEWQDQNQDLDYER